MKVYRCIKKGYLEFGDKYKAKIHLNHNEVWYKIGEDPVRLERGGLEIEVTKGQFMTRFREEDRNPRIGRVVI